MNNMATIKRTQIAVETTEEFREALKNLAAAEYKTVSQVVIDALLREYPELKNQPRVVQKTRRQ
jgi:uncharacterized protein (DUF1778 family)